MWKNMVEPDRLQITVWYMPIACWITKARNTHLEYVRLSAFPLQQWLHERASPLRHTYIASVERLLLFGIYSSSCLSYISWFFLSAATAITRLVYYLFIKLWFI